MKYHIGIDTGGTSTDAVLVDPARDLVVATAKTPTTRYRLSDGISSVLSKLLSGSDASAADIDGLAISTTLATNSVVENKGARVALLVIGFVKHFKLPVTAVIYVKGGHSITGKEEAPLELEYLVETLEKLKSSVDAYAVCSTMSMKNPTHELVAEKAISLIDPKPVFCSHRSSSEAGMKERAATAALHAKLMPVMNDFITSVTASMKQFNLNCPLAIVTGNGSTITAEQAIKQSGQTVASGPACTALFGGRSENRQALVVDIGGTTTDIAMVTAGNPILSPHGCTIGSWATHMESVDLYTGGIGGDSLVSLGPKNTLTIGPDRVIPLCISGSNAGSVDWIGPEEKGSALFLSPSIDKSRAVKDPILLFLAENTPATRYRLKRSPELKTIPITHRLEQLRRKQNIEETGFTPTDALCVLGLTDFGERDNAAKGGQRLAKQMGISLETFCRNVKKETEEKIVSAILSYVMNRTWGNSIAPFLSSYKNHDLLDTRFRLKIPLIGTGAAARFFLPAVAEKLSTSITFPKFCDVGSAVGAASMLRKPAVIKKRNSP
ncbi:MAG: hydantoinase/oxoprolinase [Proteobacteria bacterium]|nr:MAG: hydantoinase/oxoprolinase [Pseudomonadota bacterium]